MPEEAIRYRQLRADAKIASVTANLERTLSLPTGSIQLIKPNGKAIRVDATVRALRDAWEESED